MPVSTPIWTNPPTSGQLSNTHGANTGADAIPLSVKYRGPGGPSGIRLTGARTNMNSLTLGSPQLAWDSAWVGQPVTSPLPFSSSVLSSNGAVNYYGRIYVLVPTAQTPFNYAIAGVISAECQGGNVGPWRWETPVRVTTLNPFNDPQYISDTVSSGAICYVSNWLYVLGAKGIYYSYVMPDGTLTNWALGIAGTFEGGSMMASMQVSPQTFPGWVGKLTVACNRAGREVYTYDVRDDGSVVSAAVITSVLPNQRGWGAMYIDPYGGLYVIGGEDAGGVPQTMVQFNFYNWYTNTATGWGTTTALPAARSRFGFALQTERTAGTTDIYVAGGIATLGGASQSTVYTCQGTVNYGNAGASLKNGTATWLSYSGTGFTATNGCAAAMSTWGGTNKPTNTQQSTPPGWPQAIYPLRFDSTASATVPQPSLVVIGGTITNVQVNTHAAVLTRPWYSGTAPVFTGTPLGTGSSITPNADGTYTLAFDYADASQSGFGIPKALATLLDGDQIQIGVQLISSSTGEASPTANINLKIGQPPTISAVSPANAATPNNGNPPISFTYNPGAGGAAQASTRIQVKQSSTVIYDSGVRQGSFNSLASMPIEPLLLPSTAYTLIIDVSSLDTPTSWSSDTGTSTTTFTPTAFTRLGAPGTFTATADSANARVALAWGAVGSATGYNIYYRRTAVGGTFYLLAGNVQGTSFTAMDRIAVGVGYDYTISTLSAVPAESVTFATPQAATIAAGNWSAYLHIAGNGAATGIPFQVQGSPAVVKKRSVLQQVGFGQATPIARYGTSDYHTIAAKALLIDATPATLKNVQAILDAVEAGGTCWWRDALGGMMLVSVDGDQGIAIRPPFHREVDLKLTETNDAAAPIVLTGSAQGYQTAVNGNRPPLDLSERLL